MAQVSQHVNSITNSLLDIVKQATQRCVNTVNQKQVANIVARGNTPLNIGNIDWSQAVNINQGCITGSNSDLSNNLRQQALKEAQSVVMSMGINLQSSEGQAIMQASNNLATAIVNAYQSQCGNVVNQVQAVTFNGPTGSATGIGSLNWTQTQDTIISCISSDNNVVTAKDKLHQAINQVTRPSTPTSTPIIPGTRKLVEQASSPNCVAWILGILILLLFIYAMWSNRHIV